MVAVLTAQRNRPQPPIPSTAWRGDLAIESVAHYTAMRHSAYPFRSLKEWSREANPVATASLYEYYYSLEYRPEILKGAAGFIRHKLLDILRPHLANDMVVKFEGRDHMWFWDGLMYAPVQEEIGVDQQARLEAARLKQSLVTEMDPFIKRFKQLESIKLLTSRFLPDEGPHMDATIAKHWNGLVDVSRSSLFILCYADISLTLRQSTRIYIAQSFAPRTASTSPCIATRCPPLQHPGRLRSLPTMSTLSTTLRLILRLPSTLAPPPLPAHIMIA